MSSRPTRDRSGKPGATWLVVRLDLPESVAEDLLGCLAGELLGASSRSARPGREVLALYFEPSSPAVSRVEGELRRLGVDPAECAPKSELVSDELWAERYQASLVPFRLGRGFLVDPRGEKGAAPAPLRLLKLVPGRAFGTGEHPTTRLCAGLLERLVRPDSRWLDLGCGTGILSMVAACCGAGEVRAIDHDPEAVEVAREIVARNGLTDRIRVELGSIRDDADLWDGVVANVHAALFRDRTTEIANRLREGGALIASGFLRGEISNVERDLVAAGLTVRQREEEGDWAALCAFGPRRSEGTGVV